MATHMDGRYVTVKSYNDIADIKNSTATDEACGNSINLSARLLLMLKIGVVKHQAVPRGYLDWKQDSLSDFLKLHFNQYQVLNTHHVRLPKAFNAWSINVIGGLQIEFTDNLADHLLLTDDDTKVLIFHHASFLKLQTNSLFPDGLVEETLRTFALLFPQSEYSSQHRARQEKRAWFRSLCSGSKSYIIDQGIVLCGNLRAEDRQIERFTFWRDRLIILKQTYDDATPRTISQWWHDRRNGERWFTFWVAIVVLVLTAMFGFIQCVEGALQVYKAYNPAPN
ncbi:hypothetical protein F4809DRAFT_642226 [Biscogniauxia mediterranea]|nr:hypothetical protein F4809DRAFT_642226 [Biscogniauxia mediterranea]